MSLHKYLIHYTLASHCTSPDTSFRFNYLIYNDIVGLIIAGNDVVVVTVSTLVSWHSTRIFEGTEVAFAFACAALNSSAAAAMTVLLRCLIARPVSDAARVSYLRGQGVPQGATTTSSLSFPFTQGRGPRPGVDRPFVSVGVADKCRRSLL